MSEDWISLREFARRRDVTLAAVQKAIDTGRVKAVRRDARGRLSAIDAIAATEQWNGNTDVDQAARSGAPILPAVGTVAGPMLASFSGDLPLQPAGGDDGRYLAARASKQEFEAKQTELDYLKALGLVVSTEEMQRVAERRYAMVRDKLLNIPDSIATIIAAERDPARVHARLTAEVKRVLNELADAAESEVTGGLAERVAA